MVEIHVIAGLLALLAGFVALFSRKGRYLHRRSGLVFVGAMLVMLTIAAVISQFFNPNRGNVMIALLTAYLIVTALLTVTRRVDQVRGVTTALAVLASVLAIRYLALGVEGMQSPTRTIDKIPFQPFFVFGAISLAASAMDVRMLVKGSIQGAQRLIRHLGRMTFALWIATASFFLGQAKVIPEPVRKFWLLAIPVLVVLLMLLYWLGRVATKKTRAIRTREGVLHG
jgi:uncharacterized membrane protein